MDLKQALVDQVRKPNGKLGRLIARGMNKGHAKLAKWGLSLFSVKPNYYILDIGCGGGGNLKYFAKTVIDGKVYGIDYSETAVNISTKVNKKYIEKSIMEIHQSSVSSLPFNNNFFDIVTAFESYYFWPDLIRDLQEIYRVLKPNGCLILVNEGYICNNEEKRKRAENWAKLGNFKIHTPNEYRESLKEAGYSNIQIIENYEKGWITAIGMKKF